MNAEIKTTYPLNFPHAAKVGGTSIRKSLIDNYKTFFDYDHPPGSVRKYYIDQCNRRNHDFQDLNFSKFDVIFGHFPIDRYNDNYPKIALLREPIERMVSFYNYWKYLLPETNTIALAKNPIITDVKSGRMDIVELAVKLRICNFYENYFRRLPPEDFAIRGFNDDLELFYANLKQKFNININADYHERKNPQKDILKQSDRERLILEFSDDINWYKQMKAYSRSFDKLVG